MMEPMTQEAMNEKMKELLKEKLISQSDAETAERDTVFFNSLMGWMDYSEKHAKDNRDKYFGTNQVLGLFHALGMCSARIKEPAGKSSLALSVATAVFVAVSSFADAQHMIWVKGIFCALAVLGLATVGAVGVYTYFAVNDLKLRRYGESWVRHTTTRARYWQEIYLYVHDLTPYRQIMQESDKKALFMDKVMDIYQNNLVRFADNMKCLDEYVRSEE